MTERQTRAAVACSVHIAFSMILLLVMVTHPGDDFGDLVVLCLIWATWVPVRIYTGRLKKLDAQDAQKPPAPPL